MLQAYDRHARGQGRGWLIAATLLFVPALLSKPTSWTLPLFLLLLDAWPYDRLSRAAVVEKLPLIGLAAVFGWIAYVSQQAGPGAILPDVPALVSTAPLIICHNTACYFYKPLWPLQLCPQYPAPPIDRIQLSNPAFAAGVTVCAVIVIALVLLRRHRAVWVCVLGYIVLINPVVLGAVK